MQRVVKRERAVSEIKKLLVYFTAAATRAKKQPPPQFGL